ncbi:MAG TPA: S41 family peptidase [Gaiellaceae bacterium]|jgi:carboxyl-terminal processing protease
MRRRRAAGIALVLLLLAAAYAVGLLLTTRSPALLIHPAARSPQSGHPRLAIEEVREALADSYYRPIGRDVLGETTIPSLIRELGDPNTDYLTSAEYSSLKNRTSRSYSGVGLTVEPARAGLLVTSAIRGPARKAGVRRGDIIVRIDGHPAGKLTFDQSLNLIKGEKGTVVHLLVRRPHGGRRRFTVVRQEIAVPSLRSRIVRFHKKKLGYIRLLSFPDSTADRLNDATAALVRRGAGGIVLDLRDNPGGLLAQAVRAVSVFIEDGVVCTISGLHQDETVYEVTGGATYPRLPLVVLVNRGSASAAEIVAAALQDHSRALVVGLRTYGKASVQSIRPLSNGTALKLTTAMYRTPAGRDLTGRGVRPKVRVGDDPLTPQDEVLRAAERVLLEQIAAA